MNNYMLLIMAAFLIVFMMWRLALPQAADAEAGTGKA